MNYKLQ